MIPLDIEIRPIDYNADIYEIMRLEIEHEFPWEIREIFMVLGNGGMVNSFVARDKQERLVGYVIAVPESKQLCIMNIMVEAENRLRGVGRKLVRTIQQRGRKRRKGYITTKVREKNLDAQIFFRKCGFEWVTTLHDYYDVPEDFYVMRRNV